MNEIEAVVPSLERRTAAKRLAGDTGKDLRIPSIYFRNNRLSLETKPLGEFRIPHQGRILFNSDSSQNPEESIRTLVFTWSMLNIIKNSSQNPEESDSSLPLTAESAAGSSTAGKRDSELKYPTNPNTRLPFDDSVIALQRAPHTENVLFSDGWYSQESDDGGWWRWSSGKGAIHLASRFDGKAKLSLRMESAVPENRIHAVINGKPLTAVDVPQGSKMVTSLVVKVKAGINILELSSRRTPVTSSKDSKLRCFSVGNLSFISPKFGFRLAGWTKAMKLRYILFYERYYLDQINDIANLNMKPVLHYLRYGGWEGKDPNPLFSSNFYLKNYRDVYLSGMNPLLHYILHGWKEGRDPHPEFSTESYLIHYGDVKLSGMNPLSHYLLYGILEGRKIYPSGYSTQE
jgi:hypothetical protein